jgi:predicted Zn-ribbon and HTH transcriptional regulator
MAFRRDLMERLSQPMTPSALARELGLNRRDIEDDIVHVIRSARAAGHRVIIEPARCKHCGFTFGEEKLSKPGKCPECRGSRLFEPVIRIEKVLGP